MRKWIDQSTFDELLLANVNANMEQAIRSASAVLEAVQAFVPEATFESQHQFIDAVITLKPIIETLIILKAFSPFP